MTSLAEIFKAGNVKQGYMNKTANAKGKDQIRDNKWEQRWFILKGNILQYYKNREDGKPKGELNLVAARVDPADQARTARPFCIRIQQAKQVFTYVQCSSDQEFVEWLNAIRVSAGYPAPDLISKETYTEPKNTADAQLSWGCLTMLDETAKAPERVVITIEPPLKYIRFIETKQMTTFQLYKSSQLISVVPSITPGLRLLDSDGVNEVYSCALEFKTDDATHKYNVFLGSLNEASSFAAYMDDCRKELWADATKITQGQVFYQGSGEIGHIESGGWAQRWVVVTENNLVLFRKRDLFLPVWAFNMRHTTPSKVDKNYVRLRSSLETIYLKFDLEALRDSFWNNLEKLQKALGEKKEAEDKKRKDREDVERKRYEEEVRAKTLAKMADASKAQDAPKEESKFEFNKAAALASTDNSFVVAWGLGTAGQLGQRSKESFYRPQFVGTMHSQKARSISAGYSHAVVCTEKGHVYCWGNGEFGQLGLGPNTKESPSPFVITTLFKEGAIVEVACGRAHTIVLSKSGKVLTWGCNEKGQLGNGNTTNSFVPIPVNEVSTKQCRWIAAGGDNSAAIVGEDVYMWGDNETSLLPNPDNKAQSEPVKIEIPPSGKVKQVSIDPGRLYTWGANARGQLGLGDRNNRPAPSLVQFLESKDFWVRQIALGGMHTICLANQTQNNLNGCVLTWGAGVVNAFKEDQLLPVLVSPLANSAFVSASDSHTITISSSCLAFAFGINEHGELGNGKPKVQALVKVDLVPSCQVVQAACGHHFSVALIRGDPPPLLSNPSRQTVVDSRVGQLPSEKKQDPFNITATDDEGRVVNWDDANAKIEQLLALVAQQQVKKDDVMTQPIENVVSRNDMDLLAKLASLDVGSAKPAAASTASSSSAAPAKADAATADFNALIAMANASLAQPASSGTAQPAAAPAAAPAASTTSAAPVQQPAQAQPAQQSAPAAATTTTSAADSAASTSSSPAAAASTTSGDSSAAQAAPAQAAPAAGGEAPLPPFWKTATDPKNGRTYFYNSKTKQASWTRPTA